MTPREGTRLRLIETLPALFIMGVSVAILLGTADLEYWANTTPGSRFLPVWLAGSGLLLGVLLLATQLRGTDAGSVDLPDMPGARRVAFTLAAMVVMTLAAPWVGMIPMLALFMGVMLVVVLGQPPLASALTTVIVVLAIEVIFVRWLLVPLPAPLGL